MRILRAVDEDKKLGWSWNYELLSQIQNRTEEISDDNSRPCLEDINDILTVLNDAGCLKGESNG